MKAMTVGRSDRCLTIGNMRQREEVTMTLRARGVTTVSAATVLAVAILMLGAVSANAQETQQGDEVGEGVKVHGSWLIEVRNADGTLVSRHEFENALLADGAEVLGQLMTRQASVGAYRVFLGNATTEQRPCLYSGNPVDCIVDEPGSADPREQVFKTLTVTFAIDGPNANKTVLSGTATAQRDGEIDRVSTFVEVCGPGVAPATCPFSVGSFPSFSGTNLPSPVAVSTGQSIQVTVVLSFS
jgi:hypothetical protein